LFEDIVSEEVSVSVSDLMATCVLDTASEEVSVSVSDLKAR
jgi:hypothetical protein